MTPTNRPSSSPNSRPPPHPGAAARRCLAVLLGGLLSAAPAAGHGLCQGELERAREMRQRIDQEWPLRPSGDEATQFIQRLGVRLAQSSAGGGAIPWRFSVARNLAPNAFSIGAGYVYVTEGAITFAQSESELAAILAHELGHELAGHFCGQAVAADSGGLFDLFADSPPPERREVGSGSVRQTLDPRKEEQADQIAVAILLAAGYPPKALLQVARRLPAGGDEHLQGRRRIESLERIVAGHRDSPDPPDSADFKEVRRGLMGDAR
jgi:predicted Zn-dependent protease